MGIEPTSESRPSPDSTCVVYVLDWVECVHKQTQITLRRLKFRSECACDTQRAIPLNVVLSQPMGEVQ